MSARQNKKQRKGRNSANNRERTVTTLTENPNTPYLVPTPSDEPPASHLPAHKAPLGAQPYQMSSNFGGFQPYAGTFNPQQQPYFPPSQSQTMQQQQGSQQYQYIPPLSPGKSDLEILQNLKQLILDSQHPIYRAVPQPAALAKLYKGPLPAQGGTESGETSGSGLASAAPDSGRLATRISSKDSSSIPLGPSSANPQHSPRNSYHNSSGNNPVPDSKALVHRIGKSVSNSSHSAGLDVRSAVLPTSEDDRDGRYEYPTRHRAQQSDPAPMGDRADYPSNGIKKQSVDDPMDETHGHRDKLSRSESWTLKQPPVHSESGRPGTDRTPNSRGGAAPLSAVASGPADTRSTTTTAFGPPDNDRERDGGANTDSHAWSWQDRNYRRPDYNRPPRGRQQSYHRPRRMSSASDHHRPLPDDPPFRRGGPAIGPSQSHVPVDSRGPPTDAMRPSASSDRVSDELVVDSKRSVDYHLQSDSRVPPLLSRVEGNAPNAALSTRPSDTASARALGTDLASQDPPVQDPGHPSARQSPNNTAGGGGGSDLPNPPPRSNPRPFPHHGMQQKKKFQKNLPHGAGLNNQGGAYGNPASDHPPPRSGQGRPPSPSVPMSSTSRPVHPRSSSGDARRGRFPSPGARVWDRGGPPSGRDLSRDRPPTSYRGDYEPDITPMRYGDTRSYGRDYSPPPQTPFPPGERGPPGTYTTPSSGVVPGRDWGGYPASYGNRRDWTAAEEEAYIKSRTWEGRPPPPPPPSSDRERYDYRNPNWVERDYPGRDSYPPGPSPPVDDRYSDRGRPSVYPPYNRVTRPRSPSPLRRGGPDNLDDRPPVKRPREEYDPVEYYPPPPTAGRRGPGEYPHPQQPRAASPGPPPPPPGSGASWPPPTPSSGSSGAPPGGAGLPSDRDYRYPPPVSGGYERPRSPGPPHGRPPYSRGGYGRDGGRNTYPPRP